MIMVKVQYGLENVGSQQAQSQRAGGNEEKLRSLFGRVSRRTKRPDPVKEVVGNAAGHKAGRKIHPIRPRTAVYPRENKKVDKKTRGAHDSELDELPHTATLGNPFERGVQTARRPLSNPIPVGKKYGVQAQQRQGQCDDGVVYRWTLAPERENGEHRK